LCLTNSHHRNSKTLTILGARVLNHQINKISGQIKTKIHGAGIAVVEVEVEEVIVTGVISSDQSSTLPVCICKYYLMTE